MTEPHKTFPLRQRPSQIWSIQYLRASAAISVLVYHKFQDVSVLNYNVFHLVKYGVDLFFVISGFIIFALTQGTPIGPKRFMYDRLTRIAPTYWLVTAMVFLMASLNIPIFMGSSNLKLLIKSLMFIPADNNFGRPYPTLFLGWTLNYEMFFYVVFCTTLFVRQTLRLLSLTMILVPLIALGFMVHFNNPIWLTYTSPRLADFLGGAWLGQIFYVNMHTSSNLKLAKLSSMVVLLLAMLGIFYRFSFVAALSVSVLATLLLIERADKMPRWTWIKFIGDASFSIYLFQQFAFDVVDLLARRFDAEFGTHVLAHIPQRCVSALAALGLGCVLYITIEKPLTRFVRKAVIRRQAAPGLGVAT
jgi:exopolysaccharide production protein ExoZ